MPFSLDWMNLTDVDDATRQHLQLLFGQGQAEVDTPKILRVQQQLRQEMYRRDATAAEELIELCDQDKGQIYLMVNAPTTCPAEQPCLHDKSCTAESDLPEGAACKDHTASAVAKLQLGDLKLYGQCRKDAQQLHLRQFGGDAEPAAPAETKPAEAAQACPPVRAPPLACPVCAPGTSGGCLSTYSGKCWPFNEFGVCPDDAAPCHPNPCRDIQAPCYDPVGASCLTKVPDTCRLLDPSGNVCLSHACPTGSIESTDTAWQRPFYRDPINYAAGLTAQRLAGAPVPDYQLRLPAGSSAVVPLFDDSADGYVEARLAAGSAWGRRSFPSWDSSIYVLP